MTNQTQLPGDLVEAVAIPKYCSDETKRHLEIRNGLNRTIFNVLRGHKMGNMCDADDHACPYPLVDLMSSPPPSDISTGEMEMVHLADVISEAVEGYITAMQAYMASDGVDRTKVEVPTPDNMDGMAWAKAFVAMRFQPHEIDEGLMVGWFANAIMAGYDTAHRRAAAITPQTITLTECVITNREVENILNDVMNGRGLNLNGYRITPLGQPDPRDAEIERLREAINGITDDYMTSETHHPGYVLIPTAKFDQLAALAKSEPEP